MLNKYFFGFLIALAFNAFSTNGPSIKAGPCVHLRDPFACNNYPTGECFWDVEDQRCESRRNDEDRCSLIHSRYRCINSPWGCFWDEDDQRCERRD